LIIFQAALLRRYFAGWRYAYPAYGIQSQYVNRRRTWGRWNCRCWRPQHCWDVPGRPGQPAGMRAEGRVLHGRCLGPTRSLQG